MSVPLWLMKYSAHLKESGINQINNNLFKFAGIYIVKRYRAKRIKFYKPFYIFTLSEIYPLNRTTVKVIWLNPLRLMNIPEEGILYARLAQYVCRHLTTGYDFHIPCTNLCLA